MHACIHAYIHTYIHRGQERKRDSMYIFTCGDAHAPLVLGRGAAV